MTNAFNTKLALPNRRFVSDYVVQIHEHFYKQCKNCCSTEPVKNAINVRRNPEKFQGKNQVSLVTQKP